MPRRREQQFVNRRAFLRNVALGIPFLTGVCRAGSGQDPPRRNVLLIITDQQFADAMSCRIGKEHIHAPAMDSLAAGGILFSRAYCANPVCVPSRAAMFTGRYPAETGVLSHVVKKLDHRRFPCMGILFRNAGYDTGYVGKWYVPIPINVPGASGFEFVENIRCNGADPRMLPSVVKFLKQKRSKPFLLVASFNNPHNICEWARGKRGKRLPDGHVGTPPAVDKCPPLRANHLPPKNETDIMALLRRSYQASRTFPVGAFGERQWREYIWAYYRMIESVDRRIGKLLNVLRETGQENKTVIVFTSDHGDCQGAHGWNQKTVFYDESARVPLIIAPLGHNSPKVSDRLVNTGVDLLPTLCDYAGIPTPKGLSGLSLKTLDRKAWREYVVYQNQLLQGARVDGRTPRPSGRMVRSDRFKYCLYGEGRRRESLVDMKADPGEMVNQAGNPEFRDVLRKHRAFLREFAERHNDAAALKMLSHVEVSRDLTGRESGDRDPWASLRLERGVDP